MISKYFDAGALGKIKDQELLGRLWHIKGIKVLEDTLKTPEEYLEGKYFAQFEKLDPEAKIINNYNDNYSAWVQNQSNNFSWQFMISCFFS